MKKENGSAQIIVAGGEDWSGILKEIVMFLTLGTEKEFIRTVANCV